MSRQEAIAAIKRDYDSNYFVSGRGDARQRLIALLHTGNETDVDVVVDVWHGAVAGDMSAYDSSCLFADPFAGFNGVERFQNNVRNLGGLM